MTTTIQVWGAVPKTSKMRITKLAEKHRIIKERHILKAVKDKIGSENPDLIDRIEMGENYGILIGI